MPSIKEHLTMLYWFVDTYFKHHPQHAQWRRSNHHQPALTDAEIITMALMQGYFQTPTLKRTYELVRANDPRAFPKLCSYKQWVARLHALAPLIGELFTAVPVALAEMDDLYLMDSQPLALCHPVRHGRVRWLREEGACFGKTKKGWFFGFKLPALVPSRGQLLCAVLPPGHWDDREGARALAQFPEGEGLCLAAWGDSAAAFSAELWAADELLIITRADIADARQRALHSRVRERVETTFSQLWNRFVTRIYARSWQGLWNTLKLKLLEFKLCHAGIISTSSTQDSG